MGKVFGISLWAFPVSHMLTTVLHQKTVTEGSNVVNLTARRLRAVFYVPFT